jgi:hypothetical protein
VNKLDFEHIYQVDSFLVSNDEEVYVNELLKAGWQLLAISNYKDEYTSYTKYVLGADKETTEKINFQMLLDRENND